MERKLETLPIVDGKKKLHMKITLADIRKGINKKPGACAAAVCLMREHHAIEARVHISRTYLRFDTKKWIRYETPRALRDQIVRYDTSNKFDPGEYEIKPFRPSHRIGSAQGSETNKNVRSKNTDSPRRKHHKLEGIRTSPFSGIVN
jgi:hypothetical protein